MESIEGRGTVLRERFKTAFPIAMLIILLLLPPAILNLRDPPPVNIAMTFWLRCTVAVVTLVANLNALFAYKRRVARNRLPYFLAASIAFLIAVTLCCEYSKYSLLFLP